MKKIIGLEMPNNSINSELFYTKDSGKIIYRNKIDTLIGIKHPGIILGDDLCGTTWVIHNHYQIGFAEIVTFNSFAAGTEVFYDNRPVNYNPEEIIARAIDCWLSKKEYHWLFNNCQHFVNNIVRNKHSSETLNRVGNFLITIGLGTGSLAVHRKRKEVLHLGIFLVGLGLLLKLLNNI